MARHPHDPELLAEVRPIMQALLRLEPAERAVVLCWFCCGCGAYLDNTAVCRNCDDARKVRQS